MESGKGYILVEGHGEIEAAQNLVTRLSEEIGFYLPWSKPRRWPSIDRWEARRGGLRGGAELFRSKPDASALLILKDEDDGCPKELAPRISQRLRDLSLPFPVAYVLLKPEYEVFFLPCLRTMGFPDWDAGSWESRRGVKEWLSNQLPRGKSYKPTVDQLRMTRLVDLATLRSADVPCFGTLERSLRFLKGALGAHGAVYP